MPRPSAPPPPPLHSTSPLPALARLLINGGHCMVGAIHAHQCLHPPPGRPAPIYLHIHADRALASNPAPAGPLHPSPSPSVTHPAPLLLSQCRLPASSVPGILELEVGGDVKVAACVTTAAHLLTYPSLQPCYTSARCRAVLDSVLCSACRFFGL